MCLLKIGAWAPCEVGQQLSEGLPDAALDALDWVLTVLHPAKHFGDDCYEAAGVRLQCIPLLHDILSSKMSDKEI